MRDPIRLRRSVTFLGASFEVEALLQAGSSAREIVVAARELERAAQVYEQACWHCGTPPGNIHFPDCPLAGPDLIGDAHAEAIAEGMAP